MPATNGGLDAAGCAYSTNLLGPSVLALGVNFYLGTPGLADAVSNAAVPLPAGSFQTLNLAGTAVNGSQASQSFVVTYTDGTTSTFTQSMSDWGYPQKHAGETIASAMTYRITPASGTVAGAYYVYAYSFALNSAKTVASLTLPANRNVTVLAITLSGQVVIPKSQTIAFGAIPARTAGTALTLTATASSGLAVSYASSTASVCTVSGSTASLLGVGVCTIAASQGGSVAYEIRLSVRQIAVGLAILDHRRHSS